MSKMPSKATTKPSRLTRALLETARDMKDAGVLTEPAYEKITLRHLGKGEVSEVEPITGQDIRTLREQAHMSLGRIRAPSQRNGWLCVAVGAWREASDGPGLGAPEYNPAQGYRGDPLKPSFFFAQPFVRPAGGAGEPARSAG